MIKSMNTKEFNEAYERLTPKQKEVLKPFLAGKSEEAIAQNLDCTDSNVRRHIANVCREFGFANEDGEHLRQRQELVELFAKHRPQWVSAEVVKKYLGQTSPPVEIETPEGIAEFQGHQNTVTSVSFSPSGEYLATGSEDGTTRLWRVETLDELLARGCDWLQCYLANHPEAREKLKVCQN